MQSTSTQKIEDALDGVINRPTSTINQPAIIDSHPTEAISFPELLDFSFPENSGESRMVQVGEVSYIGDGVCHVTGLTEAKVDEIITIKTKHGEEKSLIFGITEDKVESVVIGDYTHIKRGDIAQSSGSKLRIPVGKSLLGRVINPLGEPLDGKGKLNAHEHHDIEFPSPGVIDRDPVTIPLNTGIIAIDATIPIGRGQRELVIGDRKTGKSRTMIDIISNQTKEGVYCIYVGIGLQASKAKATFELLQKRGVLSYTTLVFSFSDDPPAIQYLAPYAGAAIGEYYMYSGKHALVIYDDLSKQAKAYRQVSLLLKRSPGRDAYPGDIFFLHSRLLERASQLGQKLGGGSLTALPIAETQSGDMSDYIITNLMSITDGHIFLDAALMHDGLLPAINPGASVSRIGGKVQTKLLQKVGEQASRIMARFEEVKSFETINTEISAETVKEINRGKRIKEFFAQDSDAKFTTEEIIIFLAIGTSSKVDHWTPANNKIYKTNFPSFIRKYLTSDDKIRFRTSSSLDDVADIIGSLFDRFCHLYDLPPPPSI
jgi:F-type H+/Na+-transporting ATPase subunit alpha